MQPSAEEAVNAINGVFGRHPGCRAAHARGTICRGVFVPTRAARELTTAAHIQADEVEVTARISNASGNPGSPDAELGQAYGLATRFHLPDGEVTDIVAVTLPCFFVRTPEHFVELSRAMRLNRRGRRAALSIPRILAFAWRHPESRKAIAAAAAPRPVPSYANCRFNAIHSYKWIAEDGRERFVRYNWVPEEGERPLWWWEAMKLDRDYLQRELVNRLGRTPALPVRFSLRLQLASREDLSEGRVCDPTAAWPTEPAKIRTALADEERERFVDAGLLELRELGEEVDRPFDPTRLTAGIDLPRLRYPDGPCCDEILGFRPSAYDYSYRRRTGASEPQAVPDEAEAVPEHA